MIAVVVGLVCGRALAGGLERMWRSRNPDGRDRLLQAWPPLVFETVTAFLFVLAAALSRSTGSLLWLWSQMALYLSVTVVDLRSHTIPNRLLLAGLALALCLFPFQARVAPESALLGAAALFATFFLLSLASRGGVGGGDVKFAGLIGIFVGLGGALPAFLVTALSGGLTGVVLLVSRRKGRRDVIAFGPFLALGACCVALWLHAGTR